MKGKKTGGKNFKPGQSGNPNGRPKMPPEVKESRKLNQASVELLLNKYLLMPFEELKALIEAQKCSAGDMLIATVIYKGITKGDHYRLDFLLNRLIGKVTDRIEHKGVSLYVIEKRDGGRIELGSKLIDNDGGDTE